MQRGHRATDRGRVEAEIGCEEIDPLVHPHRHRPEIGEHVAVDRAHDSRHRHTGGAHRVLEVGVGARVPLRLPFERLLHRPGTARRREPPHLALFSARHGPRKDRVGTERVALGECRYGFVAVNPHDRTPVCSALTPSKPSASR